MSEKIVASDGDNRPWPAYARLQYARLEQPVTLLGPSSHFGPLFGFISEKIEDVVLDR